MTFFLSKFLWLIINPFNILLSFILFGLIIRIFKFRKFSNILFLISFGLFLIAGVLPTGSYLIYLLEKNYHNSNKYLYNSVDGILILGGTTDPGLTKEYNQISVNESSERLLESLFLIKRFPKAKIYFAGGLGSAKYLEYSHSFVAEKFYQKLGLDTQHIFFDYKSRNTYENLLFAKEKFNPKKKEKWLIITSAFHLTRAINIGEKLEWKLIPYATDFRLYKEFKWKLSLDFIGNLSNFQFAAHEWVGLIAYYIMGRTAKIY